MTAKAYEKLFTDELNLIYGHDDFHQQWTPVQLAEETCSKLDEVTDWSGRICVFYCCSMFRSVLKRVVKLYGMEHACRNITFIASNMEKIEFCQRIVSGKLDYKYIPQEELNHWLKGKPEMEFDVVLGNPPYQNGKHKQLYVSFINLSLHIVSKNGWVCLITPKTF